MPRGDTPPVMLAIAPNLDLVLRDIGPDDIRPHFQPIVDLAAAAVIGYETLSRGPAPFESPALLFGRARMLDLTAELEHACHTAALSRIAALARPGLEWFVNVTPEVFSGLDGAATAAAVRAYGLDPADLVFEITERDAVVDHDTLHRAVRAHADEGFRIALDDFGSGSNGLVALAAAAPHVIKLDMELTRGVNANPYKQSIIRSVVSLAASVDARLIAEGVETWPELEMLVRQGVRFAQGRLLGEPRTEPCPLAASVAERLLRATSHARLVRPAEESVSRVAIESFSLQHGSMTCGELAEVFARDPDLDCAVVLHGDSPVGVIARPHLLAQVSDGGAHKLADAVTRPLTLVVDEGASIVRLATLAMNRGRDDVYDPVIVVRGGGTYHGTVTMRQLIMRAAELAVPPA